MAQGNYYFSTGFTHNVFGADEHLSVVLWREGKTKYKCVSSWEYSTFMMKALANRRAESRIARLKNIYGAVPLPK
jgi:hypothetical protein